MRADQHKCLPHKSNATIALKIVGYSFEYYSVFGQQFETNFKFVKSFPLQFDPYLHFAIRLNSFRYMVNNSKTNLKFEKKLSISL